MPLERELDDFFLARDHTSYFAPMLVVVLSGTKLGRVDQRYFLFTMLNSHACHYPYDNTEFREWCVFYGCSTFAYQCSGTRK
ncbi:MAG: hypothetical protein ACR2O2_14180 [Ruegeria sp.]